MRMGDKQESAQKQIDPSKIMQIGMGFSASKTLLTAVSMGLFTLLGKGPLTGEEVRAELGLHERSVYDFLDSLLSLDFLKREGNGPAGSYSNSEDTGLFLDESKPSYVGGFLKFADDRLYGFWGDLEEGLKTGKPQNETKHTGESTFDALYPNPEKLKGFVNAMSGIQMENFIAFSRQFDFSRYNTLCDIGGSAGILSIQVALNNEHMKCTSFDLPAVEPIARETIAGFGIADRAKAVSGDFFTDDFPKADMITMGNILHDWNLEEKKLLIKKAYDALPEGGAFVAIEEIIDDGRRENSSALLMSLNMLIEIGDAFNFSGADFNSWTKEAGFKKTDKMALASTASAVIAYK